ncbi:MAG: hypothetical protein GKR91_08505 [Pseudomonadales bacterium]|nr:hypothetical protein [Pseudomonadales bacterium]
MDTEEKLHTALAILTEGKYFTREDFPEDSEDPRPTKREWQDIEAWQKSEKLTNWTHSLAVSGFGIGVLRASPTNKPVLSLRVYTENGCDLKPPQDITIPHFDTFTIEKVEIGKCVPTSSESEKIVPGGGCKITVRNWGGTLGYFVGKNDNDRDTFLLSNCHVIANNGIVNGQSDLAIFQGDYSSSNSDDEVAQLSNWVPLKFCDDPNNYQNLVDAAIGKIYPCLGLRYDIPHIADSENPIKGFRKPERGSMVRKYGYGSGLSCGEIVDVDFMTSSEFFTDKDEFSMRRVGFKKQILCVPRPCPNEPPSPGEPFTVKGDSGAVVVDEDNYIVGLNWGGTGEVSADGSLDDKNEINGVANNIVNVFDKLKLDRVITGN